MGAYLQTTTRLSDRLDFVAALRVDDHEHLQDPVVSPRAAFVFAPNDRHTLRATYNRAFSTPGTNGLFLDIVAGRIPILPTVGYNIRASGVGTTGFTFNNTCHWWSEQLLHVLAVRARHTAPGDGNGSLG